MKARDSYRSKAVAGGLICIGILALVGMVGNHLSWKPGFFRGKDSEVGTCTEKFQALYKKDSVDFRIFFGYKDGRPARFVGDRYERVYLIQRIRAMGFVRDRKEGDLFTLRTGNLMSKRQLIRLRIIGSSVGPDDQENAKDPYQRWRSEYAKNNFRDALQNADVILYNGHSRDGGGPDFEPPRVLSDSRIDYPWYRKSKPGFQAMLSALKESKKEPTVIGLLSCLSKRHFATKLQESRPNTALLVSDALLYYSDALEGLLGTLNQIVERKCNPNPLPYGLTALGFFTSKLD